jgi:hypothetical protein
VFSLVLAAVNKISDLFLDTRHANIEDIDIQIVSINIVNDFWKGNKDVRLTTFIYSDNFLIDDILANFSTIKFRASYAQKLISEGLHILVEVHITNDENNLNIIFVLSYEKLFWYITELC